MAQPLISKKKAETTFSFNGRGKLATKEDRELHAQVMMEVKDMDDYAKQAREDAKIAIQGYLALTKATYSKSASIFPPTIHAVTYARLALEAANTPKVEVKARKRSSDPKIQMINAAIRNVETGDGDLRPDSRNLWFHQNFDKILLGTGFRFLGYHLQHRIVNIKDEFGRWKEKKICVHDDIIDVVPDFFHVGVSRDTQPGMFGGSACYWDRFFGWDAFHEAFDNQYYVNIDKVPYGDWFQGETPEQWPVAEGWVRVRYYWNIYKDLFYVIANGVPIRKDHILDYGDPDRPRKFLPITSIHNDVNYDIQKDYYEDFPLIQGGRQYTDVSNATTSRTFWTKSDAKLIRALVGFKNALWSSAAETAKASSVHFLMAQNAGVYDQITTSNLWGIIPLRNADGTTFDVRSLTQNSQFLSQWAGIDQATDDAMAWSLGNDWKRASSELTNEKATVAAIRQQMQRIRLSQNTKFNETGGIKRHYRNLVSLIQQYYTQPTLVDLVDNKVPEDTEEEDIIRDPDGYPIQMKKYKEIPFDKSVVEIRRNGKWTLVEDSSKSLGDKRFTGSKSINGRKEYLSTEEEPEIYIEPGSTFAELKAIEKSLNLELMQSLQFFIGLAYPNKNGQMEPLIPKEGAQYLLEKNADIFEYDKDKLLGIKKDEEVTLPPSMSFNLPSMPQQMLPQGQALDVGNQSANGQMAALASKLSL